MLKYLKIIKQHYSKMSVFIQKLNPITGVNDWIVQEEDYDYHQEVARASFADMLHDTERNRKYEEALKKAIDHTHSQGREAHVLDIGTGTGLLSMMAARHGADTVTACEAFKPMSECALKIIKRNGYDERITVIPKRSTELTVGPEGDLPRRCNILVTEVFDTELIGEGALATFSHAHAYLLEKQCVVVPHSATVYAQVVESSLAQAWNKVQDIKDSNGRVLVEIPDNIRRCAGSAAVHDIQMSQLPLGSFKTIVSPLPVFRFDWSGATPFIFERSTINTLKSERNGVAQAVFMWWDLQMDLDCKVVLSCAPFWAHPMSTPLPWRDHWMQAIYYLPAEVNVTESEEVHVVSCHDEFSLWFNIRKDLRLTEEDYLKPVCECGVHVSFSRTRIGQINDIKRNEKCLDLIARNVQIGDRVLVLSDGFYVGLAAAKLGAHKVSFVETNYLSRRILSDFVEANLLTNVEIFENIEALSAHPDTKDINLVLGEPYFLNSILPWDNLMFMYLLKGVRRFLAPGAKIFPKSAIIKAIAVNFADLHKIRLPLGACEGFAMNEFDDLIENSSNISDDNVEAQPLWEYPGVALSQIVEIVSIDSANIPERVLESTGSFQIQQGLGGCNGIALWIEWLHEQVPQQIISSGPISQPEIGKSLEWDMYTRQGVCLFGNKDTDHINYVFKFDFDEGNISFKCIQ